MADEEQAGEESASGGKSKLPLLIALVVVIIAISVGGTLAVLSFMQGDEPVDPAAAEEGSEEVVEAPKEAIYYPVKPPIMVTFNVRGRQRYAKVDITLMTRDDDVIPALELHMPMVRNALNLIIGGHVYEDVQSAEGKELVRQECLLELQRLMEQEIQKPGVEQVLFTNFVMQ